MPTNFFRLFLIFSFIFKFLLVNNACAALAQDYSLGEKILLNYKQFTVAEGLSQNTVTSFAEDSDGYIWVGTVNGLNLFDGREFKHYYFNNKNGLPSSFIRNLIVDTAGTLFVGTDNGLVTFDKENDVFIPVDINDKQNTEAVWALETSDEKLYV